LVTFCVLWSSRKPQFGSFGCDQFCRLEILPPCGTSPSSTLQPYMIACCIVEKLWAIQLAVGCRVGPMRELE